MIVSTDAAAKIRATPERVFDVANDLENIAQAFVGYGPIPGTVRAEVIGGGVLAQGTSRRVYTSDGHDVVEEMLVFDRASAVAYRLTGISAPFSLLVRFARADWKFTETPDDTGAEDDPSARLIVEWCHARGSSLLDGPETRLVSRRRQLPGRPSYFGTDARCEHLPTGRLRKAVRVHTDPSRGIEA